MKTVKCQICGVKKPAAEIEYLKSTSFIPSEAEFAAHKKGPIVVKGNDGATCKHCIAQMEADLEKYREDEY